MTLGNVFIIPFEILFNYILGNVCEGGVPKSFSFFDFGFIVITQNE